MSLTLVISRVQALFEAQGQKWCDKDYVVQFLSIHNEDVELELMALGLSYEEDEIIIPAVPAGTTDLSQYQTTGQILAAMMSPYSVEWMCASTPPGTPSTKFQWVPRLDKVEDVNPNFPFPSIKSYCWKRGIIQISPSSQIVDLRVGCQLLPDVFQSDSDNYIKGCTNWLAYGTAEMIAFARGGGIAKFGTYCQQNKLAVQSSIEQTFLQQEQLTRRRLAGRRSRQRGPMWKLPTC